MATAERPATHDRGGAAGWPVDVGGDPIVHADYGRAMQLAYVDESGDSGYQGSQTYTLGCVLVGDLGWPSAFDGFIAYRRMLRTRFGIRIRDELKANYIVRGTHSCDGLGTDQRYAIYRGHMRLACKLGASAFAVVIEKQRINKRSQNPRDIAWEFLLQRLERLTTKSGEPVLLIHDQGEDIAIRKLARKARRAGSAGSAFGTGRLNLPARLLIDDPVTRDSGQSYFVQLADLTAYAAFRAIYPPPQKVASVCPTSMWHELGAGTYTPANELAGLTKASPPGIVVWP